MSSLFCQAGNKSPIFLVRICFYPLIFFFFWMEESLKHLLSLLSAFFSDRDMKNRNLSGLHFIVNAFSKKNLVQFVTTVIKILGCGSQYS